MHQKRSKKAAKRKKIVAIKKQKERETEAMLNKMTDEELRNYLGEEEYQKIMEESEFDDE